MSWLFVAIGGALGSCLRWAVHLTVMKPGMSFPYSTLIVNIAGSFLIGLLYVLVTEKASLSVEWRPVLTVGFLGALTTFSTFSLETLLLAESGRYLFALSNILVNVIFSLLACFSAVQIVRLI